VVNGTDVIEKMDFDIEPTVIGIGVGLGTHDKTVKAFSDFLEKNKTPLVIDADGLNILSKNKELLKKLPAQSILTPHPKELERLIGTWKDDFDKLKKTKAFSKKYNCIVVVKGAHSITVYGDRGYINSTGNPGMATAGSGDALTGIITGLMAQGYEALKATKSLKPMVSSFSIVRRKYILFSFYSSFNPSQGIFKFDKEFHRFLVKHFFDFEIMHINFLYRNYSKCF